MFRVCKDNVEKQSADLQVEVPIQDEFTSLQHKKISDYQKVCQLEEKLKKQVDIVEKKLEAAENKKLKLKSELENFIYSTDDEIEGLLKSCLKKHFHFIQCQINNLDSKIEIILFDHRELIEELFTKFVGCHYEVEKEPSVLSYVHNAKVRLDLMYRADLIKGLKAMPTVEIDWHQMLPKHRG